MKLKYFVADLLTLIRFLLTITIFIITFATKSPEAAFILFVFAELTDAFDGTAAEKWPFPKNKTPKYRKFAAEYDMATDMLLAVAIFLFFTVNVSTPAGLALGITYSVAAIIIDFVVYGRLLGHPDTAKPNSLTHKNFKLAKRIILTRRQVYIALLVVIGAWTFYACNFPTPVKIITTILAILIAIALYIFERQRLHNISRDAVDLEQKLEKFTEKSAKKAKPAKPTK